MADTPRFSKEDVVALWPQSAGELRGFETHLRRTKAAITADQLGMAVQMADNEFKRIQGEDPLTKAMVKMRQDLRQLLADHGVASNPGVDDEWIVSKLRYLLARE